ncbi:hypothetical protein BJV78DRAFT_928792 [Lactifluus subvellereus]|nr:hypothetical protein BJV78DRAFT_928792 [Lactifluus subvellereus]
MLQQAMTGLESPNQSQITAPSNPENITFASASPGEGSRTYLSARSGDDLIPPNKSGQKDDFGRSLQRDGVVVANVSLVHDNERSSQDEVPPTASGSTQSQSHNTSSQASLGSQLAAALDLLHKKSEEISELQAQVNTLREQTTDGDTKLGQAGNGALNSKVGCDHLAAAVQTDQEDEVLAQWTEEKTVLQGVAEALRADKARALADVDFFRGQYQRASDFTSSMRSENEELLARATLAESQSINGVAMVRATFESRVAKLDAEVQKYKALSEMLTERARRTDDDVRYRAAIAPELEREYQQLHRQFRETEAELEDTKDELRAEKKVNSRLRRLVRRLEAKEQANGGKSPEQGPLPWSDAEDDPDYLPGATPPSCPSEGSDGSSSQRGQSQGPHNEDAIILVGGEIEQLASVGPDESAQTSNNDMVYLCRWKSGEPNGNCDMVVASKQKELHEHVLSHHLACH